MKPSPIMVSDLHLCIWRQSNVVMLRNMLVVSTAVLCKWCHSLPVTSTRVWVVVIVLCAASITMIRSRSRDLSSHREIEVGVDDGVNNMVCHNGVYCVEMLRHCCETCVMAVRVRRSLSMPWEVRVPM